MVVMYLKLSHTLTCCIPPQSSDHACPTTPWSLVFFWGQNQALVPPPPDWRYYSGHWTGGDNLRSVVSPTSIRGQCAVVLAPVLGTDGGLCRRERRAVCTRVPHDLLVAPEPLAKIAPVNSFFFHFFHFSCCSF